MASNNIYSEITPEIRALAQLSKKASFIEPDLYTEYNVKRGLRDLDGSGVLVGITNISEVNSRRMIDGKMTPIDGELFYRGYGFSFGDVFVYGEVPAFDLRLVKYNAVGRFCRVRNFGGTVGEDDLARVADLSA